MNYFQTYKKYFAYLGLLLFLGLTATPLVPATPINLLHPTTEYTTTKENYNCTIFAIAKQTFIQYPDDAYPFILNFGEWLLDTMGHSFPPLILIGILYLLLTQAYVLFDAFINPITRWPLTITFGKWIDRPSFPMTQNKEHPQPTHWSPKFPARGYVWTNGTHGIVTWAGLFWGNLGYLKTGHTKDYIGIKGFQGIKFTHIRNAYDIYIGTADHVKLTYDWPGWI